MKNIKSKPLRTTKIQNNHQVALDGNNKVKHRRGWSSKNFNSSKIPLFFGTYREVIQMMIRSMIGNPVFPIMIKKDINNNGQTAVLKDIMLSGVRVYPRSVKAELAVKIPHQTLPCPSCSTIEPYVWLFRIQGKRHTTPKSEKPQKYSVRIKANDFSDLYSMPPNSSLCDSVRSTNAELRPTVGSQLKYGIPPSLSWDKACLKL